MIERIYLVRLIPLVDLFVLTSLFKYIEIKRLEIIHNRAPHPDNQGHIIEIMDDDGLRERGVKINVKQESVNSVTFYRSYYFKEGLRDPSFFKLL